MTTPKLPSAEELAERIVGDILGVAVIEETLEEVVTTFHADRNAVLEAAAKEIEPEDGWRDDSRHHGTVMHTLKAAAGVIRKLKEEP